jgi:short-subunit dehydrogenase
MKLSKHQTENSSANVKPLFIDFASFTSIKIAAAEVNAYPELIDVLINNADHAHGLLYYVDGFESQTGSKHLDPFCSST